MTELIEELSEKLNPEESTKEGVMVEIEHLLTIEETKRQLERQVERKDERLGQKCADIVQEIDSIQIAMSLDRERQQKRESTIYQRLNELKEEVQLLQRG